MKRTILVSGFIFLCAGAVSGAQVDQPPDNKTYYLIPSAVCTEMGCSSENPCCNTCQMKGWFEKEFRVIAKSLAEPLPDCFPDGCGACVFFLKAKGYPDNPQKPSVFFVTEWSKWDNSLLYRGPKQSEETGDMPTVGQGQDNRQAVNKEESRKAVENWTKNLKRQSDEDISRLKRENSEQFRKMKEILDLLTDAARQRGGAQPALQGQ